MWKNTWPIWFNSEDGGYLKIFTFIEESSQLQKAKNDTLTIPLVQDLSSKINVAFSFLLLLFQKVYTHWDN